MQCTFSYIGPLFSSGRGSFLARSAGGHAGGKHVLTAQVWAPAGLRGARSGRSKSRRAGSFAGVLSAEPEPSGTVEIHTKKGQQFFFACPAVHNSSHLRDSHVTTAASLQAFPFVAATNDASAVCACVCVCVCATGPTRRYDRC